MQIWPAYLHTARSTRIMSTECFVQRTKISLGQIEIHSFEKSSTWDFRKFDLPICTRRSTATHPWYAPSYNSWVLTERTWYALRVSNQRLFCTRSRLISKELRFFLRKNWTLIFEKNWTLIFKKKLNSNIQNKTELQFFGSWTCPLADATVLPRIHMQPPVYRSQLSPVVFKSSEDVITSYRWGQFASPKIVARLVLPAAVQQVLAGHYVPCLRNHTILTDVEIMNLPRCKELLYSEHVE